jgi:formylglycine-generating enzyme required for sulfatase activity
MAFLSRTDPSAYLEVSRLLDQGPPVKGDRKPAVYVKWGEARGYCEFKYGKGADLPTEMQWENACGSGTYCTASGNLNPTEAIYDADGPADVGSTLPNPQRVQDMTGNVWEWVLGGVDDVYKRIRGGSWATYHGYDWYLLADYRHNLISDFRGSYVGFRCVAPAMSAVEGPPLPATTPSTDEDSKK